MAAEPVAIIDIGSNSTRLLIATVNGGSPRTLHRDAEVTRLGRGVDTTGRLSSDGIEAVCAVVGRYLDQARAAGASRIEAVATSAVRDAENGDAFRAELRERFALPTRVLSGSEEARLTYLGAITGREARRNTLVCDIGGGSTELIVGHGPQIEFRASMQCGVVRQSERHVRSDPPTAAELESLADEVRGLITTALADAPQITAERAIAVAGTPTSLAAIDLGLDPYDPTAVHGHQLSIERIQRTCSELAALDLARRRTLTGLQPGRAPTIVAGVVILIGILRRFNLRSVEVSENDILHGLALELTAGAGP